MRENIYSVIDSEFKRFGFEKDFDETVFDSDIQWIHSGKEFKSTIRIDRSTNSISFEQKQLIDGEWKTTPFGVMAPLFEVIELARHAYLISSKTRAYNLDWVASNIIPGTNGNGK